MPQVTNIISQLFENEYGQNIGTFNLVANVGERITVTTILEVSWFAEASQVDTWNVGSNFITRASGNFYDDGFFIGCAFRYQTDWKTTPVNEFTANVQNISLDGKTLTFNNIVGSVPIGFDKTADAIRALTLEPENHLNGLIYKFGIIGNEEAVNYNSKVTDDEQAYYSNEIGVDGGGGRSTALVDLKPQQDSNKSWVTGSAQARFVSSLQYIQTYEIRHEFIIPYYVDGELSNLENVVVPELLEGNNSLRYICETSFSTTLTNPNASITSVIDNRLGSVGWFNENFNGFFSDYSLLSKSYVDVNTGNPVDGLQLTARTRLTIEIEKTSGSFSSTAKVGIMTSYLPTQDEYRDTPTDFVQNFRYDVGYVTANSPIAGQGSSVIKSIEANVLGSGNLEVIAEIEYNASERVGLTKDSNYLISAIIGNVTLDDDVSDRVNLIADVRNYSPTTFVEGLISLNRAEFLIHDQVLGVDQGSETILTCNEDGILLDGEFSLDLNKEAFINSLRLSVVARNPSTGNFFELDSYNFDLSNSIVVNGIQEIEINNTRGYRLINGDQFNLARIQTGNNVGGIQSYSIQLGQKIPWQDWIPNDDADSVFYDPSEPNNNLNNKASNYSGLNGYEIAIMLEADLDGVDDLNQPISGLARLYSQGITVSDYDEGDTVPPVWSAQKQTLDPDTFTDLDGSVLDDRDTLFRITWTNSGGAVSGIGDFWAVHRIEVENAIGKNIEELSTLRAFPVGQILKPLSGFNFLRIYTDSGNVVTECLIDHTKLDGFSKYKLSGRIDSGGLTTGMAYEGIGVMAFENSDVMLFENQ